MRIVVLSWKGIGRTTKGTRSFPTGLETSIQRGPKDTQGQTLNLNMKEILLQ